MTLATAGDVVRLTEWARCAGCAAKMGPSDLKQALAPLSRRDDPRLLVGHETFDDAGIFQLTPEFALVQTVDFFAPIVDDPYDFGRVAATNALSDVFAMGGEALTAMNIVGFPVGKLPIEVLSEVLRGGQDMVHAAGAHVVGGHSITDEELKYGLSVTGTVHPARVLSNAGARPGDVFVLTKGIGTGILSTAAKRGVLPEAERAALAGVGAQYESEMVYHNLKEEWEKLGVVFLSIEDGLKEYPELFREHFATIVPPEDNKFAAVNSAVWSGRSEEHTSELQSH